MLRYILLFTFCCFICCAQGQTLREALSRKDTVLALSLLQKGANPNEADANGVTPLMSVCRFPDLPGARLLLKYGAKVDEPRSSKGRTPLMVACAYWSGLDICRLLVEHGADVNAVAMEGITPLMLAALNEKQDVVEYLLAHGADPHKKDETGQTALDYARKGKVEAYMISSIKDTRFNREAVIAALEKAMKGK